jgi:hypothetical protein
VGSFAWRKVSKNNKTAQAQNRGVERARALHHRLHVPDGRKIIRLMPKDVELDLSSRFVDGRVKPGHDEIDWHQYVGRHARVRPGHPRRGTDGRNQRQSYRNG